MRVNSTGQSDQMDVQDWTTSVPGFSLDLVVNTITNADQGVVLAWGENDVEAVSTETWP
jgi:hypothetical protein